MNEFEAKFTGFTLASAKELLSENGYMCVYPEKMMTRKVFHIEGNKNKRGRVRDEGGKITPILGARKQKIWFWILVHKSA